MRNAGHRIFPLNFLHVRALHLVRAIAAVLAVVLLGNSVALAAGAPKVKTAMDPVKLKQTLTGRGLGKGIKVTELDRTQQAGILTAIHDDTFEVVPNEKEAKVVVIPFAQVSAVRNTGMSAGAKVGIVILCVTVVAGIIAVVIYEASKNILKPGTPL
jgi:hypothetical protein